MTPPIPLVVPVPSRMRRLGVVGAGTMGAGIAALAASAGIPVELLDVRGSDGTLEGPAREGLTRALRARPAAFMHPSRAALVRVGSSEDHLDRLGDCDWVIEAIIERADAKRALYERLEGVVRPDAVVSSNTSAIPMAVLAQGRSEAFRRRFLGTHFFNPPRWLHLLELVPGADTDPEVVAWVRGVAERLLGKGVVVARDVPGFIASRLGVFGIVLTLRLMEELDLGIDDVDALTGELIGRPRSATFRTADLVGLDVLSEVATQLDEATDWDFALPPWVGLVAEGRTGAKTGAGFYSRREGEVLVLDPATGDYRPRRPEPGEAASLRRMPLAERIAAVRALPGSRGEFVRRLLDGTAAFAGAEAAQIADDPADVDRAMEWGWGWRLGPLGTEPATAALPHPGTVRLSVIRSAGGILDESLQATLLDMGDGVALLEIHTKLNSIGGGALDAIARALGHVEREGMTGLVIGNEDPRAFSAGADLRSLAAMAEAGDWAAVDGFVRRAQEVNLAIRHAPFPVVAAAAGLALGGGCELAMHADRIQSHAELAIGLVEIRVGLIPAGGGVTELIARFGRDLAPYPGADPFEATARAFALMATGRVSESALDARSIGLLRETDRITMSRDRLLADAQARVLDLAADYLPPAPEPIAVLGDAALGNLRFQAQEWRDAGRATGHDIRVAQELALVLAGGPGPPRELAAQELHDLEREAFMRLIGTPATRERIAHMLATGTPLRN